MDSPREPSTQAAAARGWDAIIQAHFAPDSPVWMQGEIAAYKQVPFVDAFVFRAVSYLFAAVSAAFGFGWHIAGLFFLGAALMKLRFFDAQHARGHARAAAAGLAVGLPLELLGGYVEHASGYGYSRAMVVTHPLHTVGAAALMLGYARTVTLAVERGWLLPMWRAMSRVGRMALTNYLLQTLIATFLMYWWGLGLFNEFTLPQLVGVTLATCLGQVVLSALWLRAFTMGPTEWVWRSLIYLSEQPIVRKPAAPRSS